MDTEEVYRKRCTLRKKQFAAEEMYDALLNCRFFNTPVMRRKLGRDPFVAEILASVKSALVSAGFEEDL